MAEAKPLQQYLDAEGKPQKPFGEWFRSLTKELEQLHAPEWEELALLWAYLNLMIEGKNMLRKRHRGWGWDVVPLPESTAANIRGQNKLGFYFRVLQAKWVASRTKINAIAGDDKDESIESSKVADRWYAMVAAMIYSEKFRQQESVAAGIHGTYARYFWFDEEDEYGGYAERPVTEQRSIKLGEDLGECFDCGYVGPISEFEPAAGGSATVQPGDEAVRGMATPGQQYPGRDQAGNAESANGQAADGQAGAMVPPGSLRAQSVPPGSLPVGSEPFPRSVSGDVYPPDSSGGGGLDPGSNAGYGSDLRGSFGEEMGLYQACPDCGSRTIQTHPAAEEQIEVVTGTSKHKLGSLKVISVPYSQLRHEISCSAEESPWLRWRRRIRTEELKAKWPGLKIPSSSTDSKGRDPGMAYEEAMQTSVATNNSSTSSIASRHRQHYSDFVMWWLSPCMYADYVFPVDMVTVSGETIRAGTKGTDAFPKGMYVAVIDGVDTPLQVKDESHKKRWVTAPYHLRLFTGLGLGIQDAVEMQRQWNLILSLVFTQIRTAALGGWLYEKDAIEPDHVRKLGQPQMSVPVSLRNRPEGTRIEQLVKQMDPGQIPAHIPWYIQQLDSNMQTSVGALINEGVPGMDSRTATGTQAMLSGAQQHNAPEFALKGDADVRSAYILFELAQKHYVEPRYMPDQGKRGKPGGIWLSAADFKNGQVRFEAVRDSWLPNTKLDQQEAIKGLLLMFGGPQGLMMALERMPEFVDQASEAFGVDIQGDTFEPTALLARQRVDQIKELAPHYADLVEQVGLLAELGEPPVDQMTGMPISPVDSVAQEIVQQLKYPVEAEELAHPLAIKHLRSMFWDDDIKESDELTRACLKALIRQHTMAQAQEAMVMGAVGQMGQPPQPMPEQGPPEGKGPQQPAKPERTPADRRTQSARANMDPGQIPVNPRPQPGPMQMGAM